MLRVMSDALEFYSDNQAVHVECEATRNGGRVAREAQAKISEIAGREWKLILFSHGMICG